MNEAIHEHHPADSAAGDGHAVADDRVRRSGGAGGGGRVVALGNQVKLPTAAASEATALISMIERAAADPSIDIERIERMYAMYEKASARSARQAFDAAFALMQPDLPEIDKRGKITIKEKGTERVIQSTPYALWDDTNRVIKPILAKYGFALSFRIAQTDARLTTTAVLAHQEGHREETSFSSPIDNTGSKNNVQGWGSAFSYGKRYTGTALLNITTKGEDDDGKAAGVTEKTVTDDQADEIRSRLTAKRVPIDRFLQYMKVESISDIPASEYTRAIQVIANSKGGNQ